MPEIVLATLNARYIHAAFGLRCLAANLGELRPRALVLEFEVAQRTLDVIERILIARPTILGLGVYIWNAEASLRLAREIKRLRPDLLVVLGGPEVSHETDEQEICGVADYVVRGEADLAFADLCRRLLAGQRPLQRVIDADPPTFDQLRLPYEEYTDADIAGRTLYVEASRGCPFRCEFCLSSLDVPVRNAPLDALLAQFQRLLDRGARHLKFVDRTFNLNASFSAAILQFLLERWTPGLFLHFEMVPDRLPAPLRRVIERFPPGALQFEVGVQTFDPLVADRISRRMDYCAVEENLRWLRERTGVHIHADLIVGLPGEGIDGFGRGFDRLAALRPHEIQVGMLKRLRGTPIGRHDEAFGMVYSPAPPYEVLQTGAIDFATMQRLRRFARYWDLIANSGNFIASTPLLWSQGRSPFAAFMALADRLHERTRATHGIALGRLAELIFDHLQQACGVQRGAAADAVWRDYQRAGRSDRPAFLRGLVGPADTRRSRSASPPARQARHGALDP